MSTGELIVMDTTGDTKIKWDKDIPDEVDTARIMFNDMKKKGYIAYSVEKKSKKGQIMREFDPQAEKMIMSPPMAGG